MGKANYSYQKRQKEFDKKKKKEEKKQRKLEKQDSSGQTEGNGEEESLPEESV